MEFVSLDKGSTTMTAMTAIPDIPQEKKTNRPI
jgi:hypothetical protein